MKASYTNLPYKRTTLLLVMLLTFTVAKAQDLIPYQIDTTFMNMINTISEEGKNRTYCEVLEKRIYETAKSKAFFDFDYALLNYFKTFNKAGYSNQEMEDIIHRMYHLLPDLAPEYAYSLGNYLHNRFNILSLFSMYDESKEWKLKDEIIKFEEVADIKRIQKEIDEISEKGLIYLMKYQFPHAYSKNYTYLDHFFSYLTGYEFLPEEYQMLRNYHKKNEHAYELIQLDLAVVHAKYYGEIKLEKWDDLDSLYQIYAAVPESEWILSAMHTMCTFYVLDKNCSLKLKLVSHILAYKERFEAKQGSLVDVVYHQLINPEFSVKFNENGLNNSAITFSTNSRNMDTLYYNVYSYEDAFSKSTSKELKLNKDKMTLVSSRILVLVKTEGCFTEKHFLQEKLEQSDNYIFSWTDDPAFFDSLTNYTVDSLSDFNFALRFYTFDKFNVHEVLSDLDDILHLVVRDKKMNLLPGVEIYGSGKENAYKDKKMIKKDVHKYLGKTNENGVLSTKLDFNLDTLKFVKDGISQTEEHRKARYTFSDDAEKTPLFEKIGYYFDKEERVDYTEFIIHTDRNKYKPNQTVHFKAIAFLVDDYDNLFSSVKNYPYEVVVNDPNGKKIYDTELKLNKWGSLSGQFKIPENAILGDYTIEINKESDFVFSVEEYKEKRAKIFTQNIEKLYELGDSVRILGNVLTNTNTGIENALITLYKKNEEISTTQTDSQGGFYFDVLLDTNDKTGYQSFELKVILGSGEVLKDQKTISTQDSKYRMTFYKNQHTSSLHLRVNNNDRMLAPFEGIQYKVKQYSKTSAFYSYSKANTDFSYEEYVRLLPDKYIFENLEKVTFHRLKTDSLDIHEFLKVFEEKRFELEFFYLNEHADTIVIDEYEIKDVFSYEDLPFIINEVGDIRGKVETKQSYLVLYLKNNLIVKTEKLNQKEIEALNGSKLLQKYERIAIVNYTFRYLTTIGFSKKEQMDELFSIRPLKMDLELHPGQTYEYQFEVLDKKGKRIKNAELLAYMCKSEFFNHLNQSYFYFLEYVINYENRYYDQDASTYFLKEHFSSASISRYKGYSKSRKKFNIALIRSESDRIVYNVPLISKDGGASGYTITREDIARLSVRNARGIASVMPYEDDIFDISVRGSRADGTYYYIDGIKVRGNSSLPKSALNTEGNIEQLIVAYKMPENADFRTKGIEDNYQIPRKRTNFEEMVFFQPKIRSNSNGIYTVKFKQNDDVNSYAFYLFGHTKKLKTGEFKRYLKSTLPVNIQVNKPRFIRERDEVIFKNVIYNETKDTLVGKIDFFLTAKNDSVALNKTFKTKFTQNVKIPPLSMKTVDWQLVVPENSPRELTFIVQLLSNVGSDIYTDDLKVLNNKMENVASLPIFKLNAETQEYVFEELHQIPESATLKEAFVYLDEDNSWNALKKFAEVMSKDYQLTNYQVAQLYAALMFKHLLASQPGLAEMLANQLGKINADKSKLLLTENPYGDFNNYGNEEQLMLLMQKLTDTSVLADYISKRVDELILAQNTDGGFPWYKGGNSNIFISNYVFTTLNRLAQYQIATDLDFQKKTAKYLDRFYEKKWNKSLINQPSMEAQILWLLNKDEINGTKEKEIQLFEEELFTTWQRKDIYHKILIGQLALKRGKIDVARKIRGSLLDLSKTRNNQGRIFDGLDANDQGKAIAATIRFLVKINPNDEEIKNFGIGLRAQQAYTNNTSYLSALDYWDALLLSHKKEELSQGEVVIRLANKQEITFTPAADKVRTIQLDQIENLKQIQVESKPEDLVTGGLIVKYEDDIENMFKSSSDAIRIQRVIFLKDKGEYRRLKEGESLSLGSEIQVEINIVNPQEIEYMHLVVPKATGMELSAERSGYYWTQGFSYYVQLKNEVVDIFLERIPKGKSRIFFSAYLTSEGKLTMAPATIQSFEHPALKASDSRFKLEVH